MANPFYSYSSAFLPGTLARAEQVSTEFSAVQAGFAILAIQGTDSGAADAYVVTTNGGPSVAYADGNIVEFKAKTSNTGAAATINVNSIGVVGLIQPNGQSLAGGAITANTWYRAIYNSTYSAWTVVAPTSLVTTSNTISASAPTFKVGLTAAGGVSTAVAPIDAVYAIDQSIVPTWTGAHTFANTVAFNSTVTFAGGLALTGAADQYAAVLTGNSGAGHSKGLSIVAGVNSSDIALLIQNIAAAQLFKVGGTGGVQVGSPTGGDKGLGTINAQALYVNNAAVLTVAVSSANPSATIGLAAVNGSAATFMTSDSAPALSQAIAPTWTAAHIFTPGSAVTAVTINAAVNNIGLSVVGGTNNSLQYLVSFATAQGSGFSSGLLLKAGTTSADNALLIQNAAATATYFQIQGNGVTTHGVGNNSAGFVVQGVANTTMLQTNGNTGCNFTYVPNAADAPPANMAQIGYVDAPINTQAGSYQLILSDRGKFINMTGAGATLTIPANAGTAFPIGTTIVVYAGQAGAITIAITADVLNWVPSVTTGSRTLAAHSIATLYKASATSWLLWGFGLT